MILLCERYAARSIASHSSLSGSVLREAQRLVLEGGKISVVSYAFSSQRKLFRTVLLRVYSVGLMQMSVPFGHHSAK